MKKKDADNLIQTKAKEQIKGIKKKDADSLKDRQRKKNRLKE